MIETVLDKIAIQAQKYIENVPVIVLGSGASVSYGLPTMGILSKHLKDNVNGESDSNWNDFIKLLDNGTDLETALQKITLNEEVTTQIIKETWNLINPIDIEVFFKSLHNPNFYSLSNLIGKLFSSTSTELNIITTNYDRLAEYACEKKNIYHFTGFSTGFLRTKVIEDPINIRRRVNILKVHGSLDWFRSKDNLLIGLSNTSKIPEDFIPEIVTPGNEKYKKTYQEPYRTIIQKADLALENNNSYLCIGYGFNDEHIQTKLVNKCVYNNSTLLILTRTLTEATKKFINKQGCKNYLAFEKSGDKDTKVYSSLKGEFIIPESDYWTLDGFLKLI